MAATSCGQTRSPCRGSARINRHRFPTLASHLSAVEGSLAKLTKRQSGQSTNTDPIGRHLDQDVLRGQVQAIDFMDLTTTIFCSISIVLSRNLGAGCHAIFATTGAELFSCRRVAAVNVRPSEGTRPFAPVRNCSLARFAVACCSCNSTLMH